MARAVVPYRGKRGSLADVLAGVAEIVGGTLAAKRRRKLEEARYQDQLGLKKTDRETARITADATAQYYSDLAANMERDDELVEFQSMDAMLGRFVGPDNQPLTGPAHTMAYKRYRKDGDPGPDVMLVPQTDVDERVLAQTFGMSPENFRKWRAAGFKADVRKKFMDLETAGAQKDLIGAQEGATKAGTAQTQVETEGMQRGLDAGMPELGAAAARAGIDKTRAQTDLLVDEHLAGLSQLEADTRRKNLQLMDQQIATMGLGRKLTVEQISQVRQEMRHTQALFDSKLDYSEATADNMVLQNAALKTHEKRLARADVRNNAAFLVDLAKNQMGFIAGDAGTLNKAIRTGDLSLLDDVQFVQHSPQEVHYKAMLRQYPDIDPESLHKTMKFLHLRYPMLNAVTDLKSKEALANYYLAMAKQAERAKAVTGAGAGGFSGANLVSIQEDMRQLLTGDGSELSGWLMFNNDSDMLVTAEDMKDLFIGEASAAKVQEALAKIAARHGTKRIKRVTGQRTSIDEDGELTTEDADYDGGAVIDAAKRLRKRTNQIIPLMRAMASNPDGMSMLLSQIKNDAFLQELAKHALGDLRKPDTTGEDGMDVSDPGTSTLEQHGQNLQNELRQVQDILSGISDIK